MNYPFHGKKGEKTMKKETMTKVYGGNRKVRFENLGGTFYHTEWTMQNGQWIETIKTVARKNDYVKRFYESFWYALKID